jgi:hypothetical protein
VCGSGGRKLQNLAKAPHAFSYLSSPSRPVEAGTDGLTLVIEPLST